MHVCHLTDNFDPDKRGGAETSLFLLCREFVRLGHRVSLVTAGPFEEPVSTMEVEGVEVHRIRSRPVGPFADYALVNRPSVVKRVVRLVKQLQPHVLQTHVIHNYMSIGVLRAVKKQLPELPLVANIHDFNALCKGALRCKGEDIIHMLEDSDCRMPSLFHCWACQKHTFNPLKKHFLTKALSRYCNRVVYVSDSVRRFYEANGVTAKSRVIYNGTAPEIPELCAEETSRFGDEHGLLDSDVIICGGRMKQSKGFHTVIDALPGIVERAGESVILVIYGETNRYAQSLVARATMLGVANRVKLLGWLDREHVEMLISMADVGIVPSTGADSLPRSVFEYMIRGLPTLGTRVGGVREVITDGENGFLITPWDKEEVAEKAARLLTQPGLRATIGGRAMETIEQGLLVSHAAKQRIDMYARLLAE